MPTEAREVRGDRGIVVAMLVIMAVRERLAGRPFERVAEMALGVFIFFSSALVLDRGGELRDPVLAHCHFLAPCHSAIPEGLSRRQRGYFVLFALLGPAAQVSN